MATDCTVSSDTSVTEVYLRKVTVGASVIGTGVALSIGVRVQAVGVETGQTNTIGTTSPAWVQADLTDTSVG